MKRLLPLILFTLLASTYPRSALAQSSIFDPGGSFGGIFQGIQDIFQGIFEAHAPDQGGATIPALPGAPSVAPSPPPKATAGDIIKMTLEWDSVLVGESAPAASGTDPLAQQHIEYIRNNGCPEASSGKPICSAIVATNIQPTSSGWCGQDGTNNPNGATFPKAVSNKLIRRDGYTYQCEIAGCSNNDWNCGAGSKKNYMEFQTLVENSNALSLFLRVKNLSDHEVKNINISTKNITYSFNEPVLPHNIEYPIATDNPSLPFQWEHGNNLALANLPQELTVGTLTANSEVRIPLHDMKSLRCGVPGSVENPNPCPDPYADNESVSCGALSPRDYDYLTSDTGGNSTSCLQREFRDVTALGGCGYQASSNNSVIGPIQFTATYGETSSSRSIFLASIPIGGQIIDDEARPFGWPATGRIDDEWGRTGKAQSEGPYRSQPGQLYSDYKLCRAGDPTNPFVHTGIDIKPAGSLVEPIGIFTTHAGWVTFAGDATALGRKDLGWMVQIESDVNQDNRPDYITRYKHLMPGSIQLDTQYKHGAAVADHTQYEAGQGVYVARNQLIGLMGDSGSPGEYQLDYEILYGALTPGDIGFSYCDNNPYLNTCTNDGVENFFFTKEHRLGELVKGPVYTNPGPGGFASFDAAPSKPPGSCGGEQLGEFERLKAETGSCPNSWVTFSWTPSANATKYFVDFMPKERGDNDSDWQSIPVGNTTSARLNVIYLGDACYKPFWWRVLAMNACNDQKRGGASPTSPNVDGFDDRGEFIVN